MIIKKAIRNFCKIKRKAEATVQPGQANVLSAKKCEVHFLADRTFDSRGWLLALDKKKSGERLTL
jgi:hypothetical protein